MSKLIAVSSYSKSQEIIVGSSPQGVVVDTGVPSIKVKAGGQGVLEDGYTLSVSAIIDSGAGATIPDPGPYTATFSAMSTKIKAGGQAVLREDDETDVINATPQIPGTPPIPFPVSFKFKISSAGQSKVKGE
jgi:hypothetical protein